VSRPYVLAGTLPILVLFLAELLSDDRQHEVKEAAKVAKRQNKQLFDTNLKHAHEVKQQTIEARRAQVLQLVKSEMSYNDIANELGVSLATVKRDTKALNGSVNGKG
jgi:ATP/maltotriose-dependent transcriptional regulator MalT